MVAPCPGPRSGKARLALTATLLLAPLPAAAWEGQVAPGLPIDYGAREGLLPGELLAAVHLGGLLGSPGRPDPAGPASGVLELRAVLSLALTHVWALELQFPVRLAREGRPPGGGAVVPSAGSPGIGPGDPWLSARAAWPLQAWTLVATAGITLPLGPVDAPASATEGRPGPFVFGTGTVNPVARLEASRRWERLEVHAGTEALLAVMSNAHGDRPGSRFVGSLGARLGLGPWWTLGLSADVLHARPARLHAGADVPTVAPLTQLLVGGSARWRIGTWSAELQARLPVAGGGARGVGAVVDLGFQTRFDVGG